MFRAFYQEHAPITHVAAFFATFSVIALSTTAAQAGHHEDMQHDMTPTVEVSAMKSTTAPLVNVEGEEAGMVTMMEGTKGVVFKIEGTGFAEGWHGAHLHQVGDCSDNEAGFKASGSHVKADESSKHGYQNPEGPEAGDLPNVFVHLSTLNAEFYSGMVSYDMNVEGRAKLLDEDGFALVLHENPDDMVSQPIGGAGPRIACAAFKSVSE